MMKKGKRKIVLWIALIFWLILAFLLISYAVKNNSPQINETPEASGTITDKRPSMLPSEVTVSKSPETPIVSKDKNEKKQSGSFTVELKVIDGPQPSERVNESKTSRKTLKNKDGKYYNPKGGQRVPYPPRDKKYYDPRGGQGAPIPLFSEKYYNPPSGQVAPE